MWNSYETKEQAFLSTRNSPLAVDAPYIIEPKTHRVWLTLPQTPKEAPADKLAYYEKSLRFYKGKPFTHHFWCNDKSLIPLTIQKIQKFSSVVEIHEFKDLTKEFMTQNLYEKFIHDNRFAFATDLVRQEILLQEGGLYADIGLEQNRDLEDFFMRYSWIQVIDYGWGHEWGFINNFALGAQKNHPVLLASLTAITELYQKLVHIPFAPDQFTLVGMLVWNMWRVMWAQEDFVQLPMDFTYKKNKSSDSDFIYHGLHSWTVNNVVPCFSIHYYKDVFDTISTF